MKSHFIVTKASSKHSLHHHRLHCYLPNIRAANVHNIYLIISYNRSYGILKISFIDEYLKLYVVVLYEMYLTLNTSHTLGPHSERFIRAKLTR